jgi:molybdenum cofactor biosynthesis enzyme MoaA
MTSSGSPPVIRNFFTPSSAYTFAILTISSNVNNSSLGRNTLGVKKLRITGGEPLLRRNLYQLIAELNQIDGIDFDIAIIYRLEHFIIYGI